MQSAVEEGVFPGAVLLVRIRGRVAYHRAFGYAALIPQKLITPTPDRLLNVAQAMGL